MNGEGPAADAGCASGAAGNENQRGQAGEPDQCSAGGEPVRGHRPDRVHHQRDARHRQHDAQGCRMARLPGPEPRGPGGPMSSSTDGHGNADEETLSPTSSGGAENAADDRALRRCRRRTPRSRCRWPRPRSRTWTNMFARISDRLGGSRVAPALPGARADEHARARCEHAAIVEATPNTTTGEGGSCGDRYDRRHCPS